MAILQFPSANIWTAEAVLKIASRGVSCTISLFREGVKKHVYFMASLTLRGGARGAPPASLIKSNCENIDAIFFLSEIYVLFLRSNLASKICFREKN